MYQYPGKYRGDRPAVEVALAREVDVPLPLSGVEDMHADTERTRNLPSVDVICGDVIDVLRGLPEQSVHACVTSPPYMGLRSYDIAPRKWDDGSECVLGDEPTLELYIQHIVDVFREVKRVLHPSGSVMLNLGNAYASGGRHDERPDIYNIPSTAKPKRPRQKRRSGKDLLLVPEHAALALQKDGWIVRQSIIWAKALSFCPGYSGSVMPECLDPSTQVFINQGGWISRVTLADIAEMAEMPAILTPTGWRPVRHVWKTVQPAMELLASKVERVVCSPQHRFPVSSDRRRSRTRLENAQDIRHTGYADYLLYHPIHTHLTNPLVTYMCGIELSEDIGYLVGAYAAEGGANGARGNGIRFTIGVDEPDFEAKICAGIIAMGRNPNVSQVENARYITCSSPKITRLLEIFVDGTCKTKSLAIDIILNTPNEFRRGLLNGYVDGDGHRRCGWTTASASRRLRDDFATVASSVGIITSKGYYKGERNGTETHSWTLRTPYITRRKTKNDAPGTFQVPPRSRRMLGENREMIDIEVDGGVFIIGDGLITHNSTRDRCTWAYENLYHLVLQDNYFYDQDGCREPYAVSSRVQTRTRYTGQRTKAYAAAGAQDPSDSKRRIIESIRAGVGRNLRNVWVIPKQNFKGAHFATFPERLVDPIIRLTTSEKGVCEACLEPIRRRVVREPVPVDVQARFEAMRAQTASETGRTDGHTQKRPNYRRKVLREEWEPGCQCGQGIVPATVMDIFSGSGRAGIVAKRLGRSFIGIDANLSYTKMAKDAIAGAKTTTTPEKQATTGRRTYSGFNARWKAAKEQL